MRTEQLRFGLPRQETGRKHLPHGDLITANNVYMPKAGVFGKRKGWNRTAQTYVGGILSQPVNALPGGDGTSTLMRDGNWNLWERAPNNNSWKYCGDARRVWCSHSTVFPRTTAPHQFACVVSSNVWTFALGTDSYTCTIAESATGTIVQQSFTVTATAIAAASAAYDGTNVWVFWTDNGENGTVYSHKFVVSTPTVAPTAATYYTMPAAPVDVSATRLQHVKAFYMENVGQIFVVACGASNNSGTLKRAAMHSVLDQASGTAVSYGGQAAATSVAYSGASGGIDMGMLSIHAGQTGSNATWYYTISGVVDTDYTVDKTVQVEVDSATFATFTLRVLDTLTPLSSPLPLRQAIAVSTGTYQAVVVTSYSSSYASRFYSTQATYYSRLYHISGSTVTKNVDSQMDNFMWVASGFARVIVAGTFKYVALFGYDDFGLAQTDYGVEGNTVSRTYFLVSLTIGASASASSYKIEGIYMQGEAPAFWHRISSAVVFPANWPPLVSTPMAFAATSTRLVAPVAIKSGTTGYVDVALLACNTTKSLGKDVQMRERGLTAGSIPMVWGKGDLAHEISPLVPCPFIVASGGGVATFNVAAAVYVVTSPDGTVWRSNPYVLRASINSSATLNIPAISIKTENATYEVEVYLGTTNPLLQAVIPFSAITASRTVLYTCPAAAGDLVNGETLYTWGGAISQSQPLHAMAVGFWKNRVFLAQERKVFCSSEWSSGVGPYFTESQATSWGDSGGLITALEPIDDNYLAMFSESRIGVLSGSGPDARGTGQFTAFTVSSKDGVAQGGVAKVGPAGVYYQSGQTYRIMVLTPSLAVRDCGGGWWDDLTTSVYSAAWCEREKWVVFFDWVNSVAYVLDYQHPTELAPFGQNFRHTLPSSVTARPYASAVDNSGVLFVGGDGAIHRPGSTWVDSTSGADATYKMKLATGDMHLGGLNNEIAISTIHTLVSVYATTGFTLTIYPEGASRTLADSRVTSKTVTLTTTNAGDTRKVMHRPAQCARIMSVGFAIEEAASITNRSFEFEGFSVEYSAFGHQAYPQSGGVI